MLLAIFTIGNFANPAYPPKFQTSFDEFVYDYFTLGKYHDNTTGLGAPRSKSAAAATYLNYLPSTYPENDQVDWEIESTVKVMASYPGTYFMVCGFSPAGYSGIQEQANGHHLAIFSMWSRNGILPTVVRQGLGIKIRPFGGEGKSDSEVLNNLQVY